jgi:AraC-like DNA-binding protein
VARLEPIAHAAARGGTAPAAGPARVGGAAGEEPAARYLCGALHFGATADHPLLSALPPVVLVRADGERPLPWLRTQLETVTCEARSGRPGGEAMIVRLAEMLFIQALRQQLGDLPPGAAGWLGALRDAALARALGAIHRRPEHPWTVAALAAEAGLSRSHFAERFAAVVGRPPLTYLAEWRMHRGRALLGEGRLRVGEVARRVGYGSEAAFSTAFRRATGGPPSAVRRRGAGEGDPGTASRVRRAG